MFLTFLRAIVSLSVTFVYGMYFWQINEEVISETLNFAYYFFLRTFYYFTDLLTVITLIYLFYKQGILSQKKKEQMLSKILHKTGDQSSSFTRKDYNTKNLN